MVILNLNNLIIIFKILIFQSNYLLKINYPIKKIITNQHREESEYILT